MAHGREADAYDYLATSKVSELTVAQLEQALENSFLNKSNIEFWKGPITMHRLLEVSRTYPWGLPIPEAGNIVDSGPVSAGAYFDFQPPGSEVWLVTAMQSLGASGTPSAGVNMFNGSSTALMKSTQGSTTATNIFPSGQVPIYVTNSLYLRVSNQDLSIEQLFTIAYHVVSL